MDASSTAWKENNTKAWQAKGEKARIYILTLMRHTKHDSAEGVGRIDVRLLQGNVSACFR
jgi:hypothetical protein